MNNRIALSSPCRFLRASVLVHAFASLACVQHTQAQTTRTWDGGASTSVLTTAANWSGDVVPVAGDTAQWDGSVSGALTLTFGSAIGTNAATGVGINVTGTQTSNLTLNATNTAVLFRISDFTVASGAGAVTLDGSGGTYRFFLQGSAVSTHTFTNNSSNAVLFNSSGVIDTSVSTNLTFAGSGNWQIGSVIMQTGAVSLSLTKNGSGTLILNGANTYSGITTVTAGTLAGIGSLGSGGTTVTGGNIAAGTDGTVGTLTFNNGLDIAGLTTGKLKFDLNAAGSSDKLVVSAGALSVGSGLLNFDDFTFTALSSFGAGVYTLLDTSTSITGTLGSSLTGTVGGLNAVLSLSGDSQDILLTVSAIPEPSTYAAFAGFVALAFAAQRHRHRKAV